MNQTLTFTAEITDISVHGHGVTRSPDGLTIFVPGSWIGDTCTLSITQTKKRYGFAQIEKIVAPSTSRKSPPCQYHGFSQQHCGGCAWMHVSYEAQLQAKQQIAYQQLKRAGIDCDLKDILPAPEPTHYRRRAQLKSDGQHLGFLASKSRRLIDIKSCSVLSSPLNTQLAQLRQSLPAPQWQKPNQKLTTLDVDEQHAEPSVDQRLPFMQANAAQNEVMRAWLKAQLELLPSQSSIVELFAGSGNLTEIVTLRTATNTPEVIAIDAHDASIAALNASFPTVKAYALDLYDHGKVTQIAKRLARATTLVLDPPRDGYPHLAKLVTSMPKLQNIFYISCNIQTWAQDVTKLTPTWQVEHVQPLDMFPQTPHLEILTKITLL